jgi:ABC-type multidrug transport system permease subunit
LTVRDIATRSPMEQVDQRRIWEGIVMYKLLSIILVAIPFILFLRTIFIGRLRRSRAVSDFRKQIDYVVWIILILIGCGLIYSLGKLILPEGTFYHFQG